MAQGVLPPEGQAKAPVATVPAKGGGSPYPFAASVLSKNRMGSQTGRPWAS